MCAIQWGIQDVENWLNSLGLSIGMSVCVRAPQMGDLNPRHFLFHLPMYRVPVDSHVHISLETGLTLIQMSNITRKLISIEFKFRENPFSCVAGKSSESDSIVIQLEQQTYIKYRRVLS